MSWFSSTPEYASSNSLSVSSSASPTLSFDDVAPNSWFMDISTPGMKPPPTLFAGEEECSKSVKCKEVQHQTEQVGLCPASTEDTTSYIVGSDVTSHIPTEEVPYAITTEDVHTEEVPYMETDNVIYDVKQEEVAYEEEVPYAIQTEEVPMIIIKPETIVKLGPKPSLFVKKEPIEKTVDENEDCSLMKPKNIQEEKELLKHLEKLNKRDKINMHEYNLRRRLILRKEQRTLNLPVADLGLEVEFIRTNKRRMTDEERLETQQKSEYNSADNHGAPRILDRYQCQTYSHLYRVGRVHHEFLQDRLAGRLPTALPLIRSPCTHKYLKPFIYKNISFAPRKVKLMEEVHAYHDKRHPEISRPEKLSFSFTYVTPKYIPAMNHLAHTFLWNGIDLSDAIFYPDYTCVALYGNMVVGFGILVPNVTPNESYISFLVVHDEFRKVGIGKIILYQLIKSCPNRDITLHVSATNPALIMYTKNGFKPEEFLTDFYDKYVPEESDECKHAFYLRMNK